MEARRITAAEVRAVLTAGEAIESYPDDEPYPSRLVLGWASGGPVHVVAADVPGTDMTIIVTVYKPDPDLWDPTFRTRR